jgi:hypothetical protein
MPIPRLSGHWSRGRSARRSEPPPSRRTGPAEVRTSAFDSGHVRLVVAVAGGGSETVQPVNLLGTELDTVGRRVLLDACHPPGTWDGGNVGPLSKEPGQCDLRREGSSLGGAQAERDQ